MADYGVLLVEDDDATRERLAHIVNDHPRLAVIDAVATCAAARAAFAAGFPDVLLVDLDLPDGNGTDLIREIKRAHPPTEAMVITVFGDERHVIAAIEAGASGYLLKDGSSEYIGEAILQMLAGGSPISASIARHVLRRFQAPARAPIAPDIECPELTAREHEVLELVAKGFSYTEIGATLGMSVNTVTSHIKHIYRKLSVRSRGEAVFEATQLGLLRWKE